MTSAARGKHIKARLEKLNHFLKIHGQLPQGTVTRAERLVIHVKVQLKEKAKERSDAKKVRKPKKPRHKREQDKKKARKEESAVSKGLRDKRREDNKNSQEKSQ